MYTFLPRPESFLQLLSRLQGNISSAKKPSSFVSNTPTVSSTRKNDVPTNDTENLAGEDATKKDAKATMETIDKSLEKPSKNLKPESAVDLVFHWSTGAGWTVDAAK